MVNRYPAVFFLDLRRCHQGWLGVDLLPAGFCIGIQVTNLEGLRWVLAGFGRPFWPVGRILLSAVRAD